MFNCYLLSEGFVTVKLSLQRILSLYRVSFERRLSVLRTKLQRFIQNAHTVCHVFTTNIGGPWHVIPKSNDWNFSFGVLFEITGVEM